MQSDYFNLSNLIFIGDRTERRSENLKNDFFNSAMEDGDKPW